MYKSLGPSTLSTGYLEPSGSAQFLLPTEEGRASRKLIRAERETARGYRQPRLRLGTNKEVPKFVTKHSLHYSDQLPNLGVTGSVAPCRFPGSRMLISDRTWPFVGQLEHSSERTLEAADFFTGDHREPLLNCTY